MECVKNMLVMRPSKRMTHWRRLGLKPILVEDCRCFRCGHEWKSDKPFRFKGNKEWPVKCPKCGSRYWWLK